MPKDIGLDLCNTKYYVNITLENKPLFILWMGNPLSLPKGLYTSISCAFHVTKGPEVPGIRLFQNLYENSHIPIQMT